LPPKVSDLPDGAHRAHVRFRPISEWHSPNIKTGGNFTGRILAVVLLISPLIAAAGHLDVIAFMPNDSCTFDKVMAITRNVNHRGAKNGDVAEILAPIKSNELVQIHWAGGSKDTATFGRPWGAWRKAQADLNSAESRARFEARTVNTSRVGYDTY
jgi:hypothetical protein